ncbi:hypothetical protein AK812_SmicGene3493 [Symbiodinium microadriaticum]|uniref:Uncharacterized protein n=1 Tax=Symbiodinium microadriaticum TaxID=2951 RepID=A0A1Q9EYZ4_SYMMI|nr:hypothetical protein AK812_SmicGene3493 [Symbiodinium microadriaticum]
MELEAHAELSGGGSDEDDDIARFERQCAMRAQAEGYLPDEAEANSDDEDTRVRQKQLVNGSGPPPANGGEWQEKCELLQDKWLGRVGLQNPQARRASMLFLESHPLPFYKAKNDLEMLRGEGLGPEDPQIALKQRLLDLTKKNRRLQVSVDGQRVRLQQLEAEAKRPKEEAKKLAEEMVMQNAALLYGEGGNVEDWKKKYLTTSNQLQQVRHELQELRTQTQKQKKVLLKELGTDESVQQAMAVADDPLAVQWKGRAAQIAQLQRQLKDFKDSATTLAPAAAAAAKNKANWELYATATPELSPGEAVAQAADKRREEFDRLQEEVEKLRQEQTEAASRAGLLESQLRDLKAHVQFLLRKSDDDDALVSQSDRAGGMLHESKFGVSGLWSLKDAEFQEAAGSDAALLQQNAELKAAQLERQAQIVLQLRSVEASVTERQLLERLRFLEAENAKQAQQADGRRNSPWILILISSKGEPPWHFRCTTAVGGSFNESSSSFRDHFRPTSVTAFFMMALSGLWLWLFGVCLGEASQSLRRECAIFTYLCNPSGEQFWTFMVIELPKDLGPYSQMSSLSMFLMRAFPMKETNDVSYEFKFDHVLTEIEEEDDKELAKANKKTKAKKLAKALSCLQQECGLTRPVQRGEVGLADRQSRQRAQHNTSDLASWGPSALALCATCDTAAHMTPALYAQSEQWKGPPCAYPPIEVVAKIFREWCKLLDLPTEPVPPPHVLQQLAQGGECLRSCIQFVSRSSEPHCIQQDEELADQRSQRAVNVLCLGLSGSQWYYPSLGDLLHLSCCELLGGLQPPSRGASHHICTALQRLLLTHEAEVVPALLYSHAPFLLLRSLDRPGCSELLQTLLG